MLSKIISQHNLFQSENARLIICNIMMSVMDGLTLGRRVKTDDLTAHIPIILLTLGSLHHQQVDGLETGVDSYLTKPSGHELFIIAHPQLDTVQVKYAIEIFKPNYSTNIRIRH